MRRDRFHELSRRLTGELGRGFDVTNLRKMRRFYRMFGIQDAVRLVSAERPARLPVSDELRWSRYRLLMQVEAPRAREWYLREAASEHWSSTVNVYTQAPPLEKVVPEAANR